jgi:hypothetical protein
MLQDGNEEQSCEVQVFGKTQENSPVKVEEELDETQTEDEAANARETSEAWKNTRKKKPVVVEKPKGTNLWLVFRWRRYKELKAEKPDAKHEDLVEQVKKEWGSKSEEEKKATKKAD